MTETVFSETFESAAQSLYSKSANQINGAEAIAVNLVSVAKANPEYAKSLVNDFVAHVKQTQGQDALLVRLATPYSALQQNEKDRILFEATDFAYQYMNDKQSLKP